MTRPHPTSSHPSPKRARYFFNRSASFDFAFFARETGQGEGPQIDPCEESVATGAAKGLRGYLASAAPVGVHLADQLLVPMALAGGGLFHTRGITDHTWTNVDLIGRFLPVKFEIGEIAPGVKSVRVGP